MVSQLPESVTYCLRGHPGSRGPGAVGQLLRVRNVLPAGAARRNTLLSLRSADKNSSPFWLGARKTVKKAKGENGHAFCQKRIAAFAAQGVQPLVRNIVTQYSPDIQVSGLFAPQDAHTGITPYRSAHLCLFDKLEFESL